MNDPRSPDSAILKAEQIPDLVGTKGASGVWQRIISEMPEHDVYIEPYWGRGTIARKKRPAAVTIGVDLDPHAIQSGIGHATMFKADSIEWLYGYFHPPGCDAVPFRNWPAKSSNPAVTAATFASAPWHRHLTLIDPPYIGCENYYRHKSPHETIIDVFLSLPCPTMLCGIWHPYYHERLSHLRSIAIPTVNRAGKKYEEWVWMNFPTPPRFHDIRFVGDNYRDRERISRRVRNWSDGMRKMTPQERQAVWEACSESLTFLSDDR